MGMTTMKFVMGAALATFVSFSHAATTYYVNGTSGNDANDGTSAAPFKTIGKALTVAIDNDRIEVAPATYKITASLLVDKAVEIVGTGAEASDTYVLSGRENSSFSGRPLVVSNALAKVANIKFRGGYGRYSDGIYPANCAWIYAGTVTNCVFADSWRVNKGYGGVYAQTEDAYVVDCEIYGHFNVDGAGSNQDGIFCAAGLTLHNGTARGCYIHDNVSRQNTGGVLLSGANAKLLDSSVIGNVGCGYDRVNGLTPWPGSGAGGIMIRNANAVVSNCVVSANISGERMTTGSDNHYRAGGIWFASAGKVYNTVVIGNTSASEGGGVWGSGYLYNCVIADNVAQFRTGGGVYGKAFLYNCTVTGNDSLLDGGVDGVTGSDANNKATVENGIVWGNGTLDSANVTLTATYMEDPKFLDAAAGDYRLDIGSPCIDTASVPSVMLPETDAAGRPRVANGALDYGALEAAPNFRVVGDPETFGVPATPAFGEHPDTTVGAVNASVPSPYTDATGLTNVVCTGYTYVAQDNANNVTTNEGADTAYAAAYARLGTLTWHLLAEYKQTVTNRGNGAGLVTGSGFVTRGATFTATATPAAGYRFWRWEGAIGDNDPTSPTLTLVSDFARTVTAVFSRDWHVDGVTGDDGNPGTSTAPFKTIHQALAVADDGDTVYVAPATYGFDPDHQALVITNAIALVGTGANRTDVKVSYKASTENWTGFGGKRLLYVDNKDAKVQHIDFAGPDNKYNRSGNIDGSTAYINAGLLSDCVFRDAFVDIAAGCGVYLNTEDAVAEDSLFSGFGSVNGYDKGGVALTIVNGLARRCEIINNNGRQNGPVGLSGAKARLFDSIITNNQSCAAHKHTETTWGGPRSGGGVWIRNAGAVVSNCVIAANRANLPQGGSKTVCTGGGIVFAAAGSVYNTVIRDNYAYLEGGGVYGVGNLYNCLIADNESEAGQGGAVSGAARLYNCTVVGNDSQLTDGTDGISGDATLLNCIVWNNGAKNYDTAAMTYSCSSPKPTGEGNRDSDPQFRSSLSRGLYCIASDSPCAKAGVWQDWMPGLKYLNGVPMPSEPGDVPMGCYAPYQIRGLIMEVR